MRAWAFFDIKIAGGGEVGGNLKKRL